MRSFSTEFVDKITREASGFGAHVVVDVSPEWPPIIILDPARGMVLLSVFQDGAGVGMTLEEASRQLSRQAALFRQAFANFAEVPRVRKMLHVEAGVPLGNVSIKPTMESLPAEYAFSEEMKEFGRVLEPAFNFVSKPAADFSDVERQQREATRFTLDAEQSAAADGIKTDIRFITGPAGSGKTLVLVSRAKLMLRRHADWNIQILCYSSVLARYLCTFFEDEERVRIDTFHSWQNRLGMSFAGSDCERASRALVKLRNVEPNIDVLLIDEIQDFCPAWVTAALMHSYRGRGGVLMVGDPNQTLYGERNLVASIDALGLTHETLHLSRPYRSTRQILEVVNALNGEFDVENKSLAPDGPLVDLVFSAEDVDVKARYLAHRIIELKKSGLMWRDICVTVPNNFDVRALAGALQREEVPTMPFWKNDHDITHIDFTDDKIKLLTAWKAKGLEFDAVFLVGFDRLKDPLQLGITGEEKAIRASFAKLCLVAPTRAKNYLSIVYSRSNVFLERLSHYSGLIRELRWPRDFEEVISNG